ncbi:MAG: hypothetical protein JNK82_14025 [Myxococcaceae bacterium]|nr:hypothetical protein [Myxococcaceae bacterium]
MTVAAQFDLRQLTLSLNKAVVTLFAATASSSGFVGGSGSGISCPGFTSFERRRR